MRCTSSCQFLVPVAKDVACERRQAEGSISSSDTDQGFTGNAVLLKSGTARKQCGANIIMVEFGGVVRQLTSDLMVSQPQSRRFTNAFC